MSRRAWIVLIVGVVLCVPLWRLWPLGSASSAVGFAWGLGLTVGYCLARNDARKRVRAPQQAGHTLTPSRPE